jgi:hypothetical protein
MCLSHRSPAFSFHIPDRMRQQWMLQGPLGSLQRHLPLRQLLCVERFCARNCASIHYSGNFIRDGRYPRHCSRHLHSDRTITYRDGWKWWRKQRKRR